MRVVVFIFLGCTMGSEPVNPPADAPHTSDPAVLTTIPNGQEILSSISSLIELLDSSVVEQLLTFPLQLGEQDLRFQQELDHLSLLTTALTKEDKKQIAPAIIGSMAFHSWRRAIGFLGANIINRLSDNREVRQHGLSLISQFLSFVKALGLRSSEYIANVQVLTFQALIKTIEAEEVLFDMIACDCWAPSSASDSSSDEPLVRRRVYPDGSSGSSGKGKSGLRQGKDDYPHRPKLCAVCKAAQSYMWTLSLNETIDVLAETLPDPTKDRKKNCNGFLVHVGGVIDFWFTQEGPLKPKVSEFCRASGDHMIQFLTGCKSHQFRSIILAVRFGRVCGNELSFIARYSSIPGMMIHTLTPVELERVDGEEEFEDLVSEREREIVVDTNHLTESTFRELTVLNRFAFESPLLVKLLGSPAEGCGTRKEWSNAFLESILVPSMLPFFEFSDERELFLKPRVMSKTWSSGERHQVLSMYRQIGRVIGIRLRDKQSPGAGFTPASVALLLELDSKTEARKWLHFENPALVSSIDRLVFDYVTEGWRGASETTPPRLGDIGLTLSDGEPVAETNIAHYVDEVIRETAFESIRLQMRAIATGLFEVIPYGSFSLLSVGELGNLLRGDREINVVDLRASTTYTPTESVNEASTVIVWFWEIINSFTEEEKQHLLRFVSGSPLAPLHGFSGLSGDKKWLQISLEEGLTIDQTPLAQTCFTQIRLPAYTSKDVMRTRILTAIQNAKTLENV